jgi:hypothetical protein
VPTKNAPSRWNAAPIGKKAIGEATPDTSAIIIRLRPRMKTVKPTKR